MKRRSAEYWKARIDEQRKLGTSAAEYCRKRSLDRGTFLRWRRRLVGDIVTHGLVEVAGAGRQACAGEAPALSIRLVDGTVIRFRVVPDPNIVGLFVAAIRSASPK